MRRHLIPALLLVAAPFATICASACAETPKLNIKLAHDSPLEQRAKAQVEHLAAQYDLKKYTLTKDINIEQGAIAHSSPVLTLNGRFVPRPDANAERQQFADDLMLSSYIHEQGHWVMMERHRRDLRDIYGDLKRMFPNMPTAVPDGDGSEQGSYIHIVVIALEWRGTEDLIGAERARKMIDWKKDDHYKAIYRVVEDHRDEVEKVMKRYGVKW
jgi:hypothetical protein